MDKAPDAFRTISEVADDLDIPQHVLRFWETRFAQIKPMKRSGGRRYYRPDDVDLLKGIRRLLYGEGYTIRGVQRILKEHGIASVQRLADSSAVASFGAIGLMAYSTLRLLGRAGPKAPNPIQHVRGIAPSCEVECLEAGEGERVFLVVEDKTVLACLRPAVEAFFEFANDLGEGGNGSLLCGHGIHALDGIPKLALLFEVEPVAVLFDQDSEQ